MKLRLGPFLLGGILATAPALARAEAPSRQPAASVPNPIPYPGLAIKEALTAAGLTPTPVEKYIYPFMSGTMGDAWCECRSYPKNATSPHIGQDFKTVPQDRYSFAISNGRVVGTSWSDKCGWAVIFEDSQGAQWRYLHIDGDSKHPPQVVGTILRRGDRMGIHSQWPISGCGAGSHLHLERLSPGKLGGEPKRRICPEYPGVVGYCGYDPATMFKTKPKMLTLANAAKIAKAELNAGPPPTPTTTSLCYANQPDITELDPEEVVDSDAEPEGMKPLISNLHPDFSFAKGPDGRMQIAIAPLQIEFDDGKKSTANKCQPESDDRESCLGGVELLVQSSSGIWKRVLSDQDLRNRAFSLPASQHYCLSSDLTKKYRLVGTTDSGRNVVVEGTFAY